MIEDKATERWKEKMKKLGLIVNMGADPSKSKPEPASKPKAEKKANQKGVRK